MGTCWGAEILSRLVGREVLLSEIRDNGHRETSKDITMLCILLSSFNIIISPLLLMASQCLFSSQCCKRDDGGEAMGAVMIWMNLGGERRQHGAWGGGEQRQRRRGETTIMEVKEIIMR